MPFTLCMGREIVRRLAIYDDASHGDAAAVNAARPAVTRLERLARYIDHRVIRVVAWDEYGIGYSPTEWQNG